MSKMFVNTTMQLDNWWGCEEVNNKNEKDLVDEGIMSDGVIRKATMVDVATLIATALEPNNT